MRFSLRNGQPVEITTVLERPELAGKGFDAGEWPAFMQYNRVSEAYFWRSLTVFPETCLVATDATGAVVANAHAVRFAGKENGREALPPGGWEQVVVWAFADVERGASPDTACALNISVAVDVQGQGQGLARLMLDALRTAVRRLGHDTLIAPVRPTWKAREPRTPMAEYVARLRYDGFPHDPWLRVHVQAGGTISGLAPTSWLIAGTLPQWRAWTGLPFDADGDIEPPGALVPVHCDTRHGQAVYVEPNVWVRHALPS